MPFVKFDLANAAADQERHSVAIQSENVTHVDVDWRWVDLNENECRGKSVMKLSSSTIFTTDGSCFDVWASLEDVLQKLNLSGNAHRFVLMNCYKCRFASVDKNALTEIVPMIVAPKQITRLDEQGVVTICRFHGQSRVVNLAGRLQDLLSNQFMLF
ncbi:MAG: hypothetical protein LBF88_03000 [Planctomycetaceae bacterium]|nr:hypothetical protein [Planctomycetaceae bacterium]